MRRFAETQDDASFPQRKKKKSPEREHQTHGKAGRRGPAMDRVRPRGWHQHQRLALGRDEQDDFLQRLFRIAVEYPRTRRNKKRGEMVPIGFGNIRE